MSKRLLIIVICCVIGSLLIGGGVLLFRHFTKETYYIAVVGDLSTLDGEDMKHGVELYLESIRNEINFKHKKIELVFFDDRGDDATAAQIALEIAQSDNIVLVVGHMYSSTSIAAGYAYKRYGVPAITASATADEVTHGNEWYFRIIPNNSVQASFIARYTKYILKQERATVIFDTGSYGNSLATSFENTAKSLGMQIVKRWGVNPNDTQLESIYQRISHEIQAIADPGVIFFATYETTAANIITLLRASGKPYLCVGGDSLSIAELFLPQFPPSSGTGHPSDLVFAVSPFIVDVANEKAQAMKNIYRNTYGKLPSWTAACHYDAMAVAVEAILRSAGALQGKGYIRSDRRKIRETLAGFYDNDHGILGVTGPIFFDHDRNVVGPYAMGFYLQQQFLPEATQYQKSDEIDVGRKSLVEQAITGEIILIGDQIMRKTHIVYTAMNINNISHFDLQAARYTVDFSLLFVYEPGSFEASQVRFENTVEPIHLAQPVFEMPIPNTNTILQIYRVQAEFKSELDLYAYPFDTHILPVQFYNETLTRDQLIYVQNSIALAPELRDTFAAQNIVGQTLSGGWHVTEVSSDQEVIINVSTLGNPRFFEKEHGITYSRFKTEIQIQRDDPYFAIKQFLPNALVIVIVFVAIMLPPNWLGIRGIVFMSALLLTAVTQTQVGSSARVVDYLTVFDYGLFFTYGIVTLFMYVSISSYIFYQRRLALVQSIYLFKSFSEQIKSSLSKKIRRRRYKKSGQFIIRQGDSGDSLFGIIEGEVGVWVRFDDGRYVEVHRIKTGGFFGEMALLTGQKRSADVISATPAFLGELTKADLAPFLKRHPELILVMSEELVRRKLLELEKKDRSLVEQVDKTAITEEYFNNIKQFFGIQ